jgi:hypothetical protein
MLDGAQWSGFKAGLLFWPELATRSPCQESGWAALSAEFAASWTKTKKHFFVSKIIGTLLAQC